MEIDRLNAIVLDTIREQTPRYKDPLTLDMALGSDGLALDSLGLLDVILELERRTGISIREETLTAEALATPATLVSHLRALQVE